MATKRTSREAPANAGATKTAADEHDDNAPIINVRVLLPPILDDDGEKHTIHWSWPLYEPQARHFFGDVTEVEGSDFAVGVWGFEFTFERGQAAHLPERFDEVIEALGICDRLPIRGPAAATIIPAVAIALATLPTGRGKRGAGKRRQARRDLLIADALVRIACGASWRNAVAETLDIHNEAEMDDAALLIAVKRSMRS